MISQLVSHMAPRIGEIATVYLRWTFSLIIFVLALLAWRLWTFTIRPLLKPDELEYLPYWIPCKQMSQPDLPFIMTSVSTHLIIIRSYRYAVDYQNHLETRSLKCELFPCVGHAISFFKDSGALYTRGRSVPLLFLEIIACYVHKGLALCMLMDR